MENINLADLRNKCLTSVYSCSEDVLKYIDTEEDRNIKFDKLKNCVIGYCQMEYQEEAGTKTIQALKKESDATDWDTLKDQYESKIAKRSISRSDLKKHPLLKKFEKHIETLQKSREEPDPEQDVAITESSNNIIDPISKRPIVNPMKNTICGHVYEKDTIKSIIANKKNRGCPYVGCTNKQVMQKQHLVVDEELLLTICSNQVVDLSEEEL